MEDYAYNLPDERIAKYPISPRDSSKLLVYKAGKISSSKFLNLVNHLPERTHLIFNNTKVIPARLYFQKKTGAKIEIFLLEPISPSNIISQVMESKDKVAWKCMVGNKKKWKDEVLELKILFQNTEFSLNASFDNRDENIINFTWQPEVSFAEIVKAIGEIPLPPYLSRKTEKEDSVNYQTVYSKFDGAVAAPTAGLHFTEKVFEQLRNANIQSSFITLHVGAGTFQPVKVENAMEHHMHSEQMVFSKVFIESLLISNESIIPVGTTSMRSLESLFWYGIKIMESKNLIVPFKIETFDPYIKRSLPVVTKKKSILAILEYMTLNRLDMLTGDTEIFIFPGYKLRMCDGIITNFHQPKSTLLLLISALTGDKWKEIYSYAMKKNFRFLSYGDSSLLLP
jgi:S-adenosylmethionine:tRNA ribosyltransferase-isomerase